MTGVERHEWVFRVDVFEVVLSIESELDGGVSTETVCDCDYERDGRCRHADAAVGAWWMASEGGDTRIPRPLYDALCKERVTWVAGARPLDRDDWLEATDGRLTVGGAGVV